MTTKQDAHLLAALDLQLTALSPLLARVDHLAADLVAAAPVEWNGPAEQAYLVAAHVVGQSMSEAREALRGAIALTGSAVRTIESRV